MSNEYLIEIKDLKFAYPESKEIFSGLNFSLKRGERIGITGPNGSGKTTLFYLIMGLLKPDSGQIKIFGKERKEENDFLEVRRRIGLLFQDSNDQLFSPTVGEDIAFGPLNLGKSIKEVKIVVKKVCQELGLEGYERRITHKLSGGEKRIVALATVIAMNPEILLLDEPDAGLDENITWKLLNYLKKQDTYVIISLNKEFLKKSVRKIYLLKDGKLNPSDYKFNFF